MCLCFFEFLASIDSEFEFNEFFKAKFWGLQGCIGFFSQGVLDKVRGALNLTYRFKELQND